MKSSRGQGHGMTNEQIKYVEGKLQEHQAGILAMQMALNKQWNVLNAVLRALLNDKLLTEESLERAGRELMAEYEESKKQGSNSLTPFDQTISMVNKGTVKGG